MEILSVSGIFRFKIPTRSLDVNYIANMFHATRKKYR